MRIKIYQINQNRDQDRVKFCGLEETEQHQRFFRIDPGLYDEVFDGEVNCVTLEDVYTVFNTAHPSTHRGHSLSVSDIVEITESSQNHLRGCFFCDKIGFESIDFDASKTVKPDNLLRVVMLESGKPAYAAEIADELRAMQHAVNGYIEVAYPFQDNAVLIANEEGLIRDMEINRVINGQLYVGPLVVIGDNCDGSFCSLTDEQTEKYLSAFQSPGLSDQNEDTGMNMV